MAKEIERKFLVELNWLDNTSILSTANITQGYLSDKPTVRIRIQDKLAYITIKSENKGITRNEFEYEIPLSDAMLMMKMCGKTISKKRISVDYDTKHWTIDVFYGDNNGLVVAEIELQDENEEFELPPWIIEEVSDDKKYYNSNLIENPYKDW
jgi:adenylate cyclase